MNKSIVILAVLFFCTMNAIFGQASNPFIQVKLNNSQTYTVNNYARFNFKVGESEIFNSKVYIVNDSQFLLLNRFNEIGLDTFNIKNISSIKVKLRGQKRRINPVFTAVGLVFFSTIAIPILVFKLLVRKTTTHWVDRGDYTIAIYNNQ